MVVELEKLLVVAGESGSNAGAGVKDASRLTARLI